MKGTIELAGMEFHSFHGCLESERREGNTFVVDFVCDCDLTAAAGSDSLEDTLDYSAIYRIVASQMSTPSNLLEHVASRIVDAISAAFPELGAFKVTVSKKNPPVQGPAAWARVTAYHEDSIPDTGLQA